MKSATMLLGIAIASVAGLDVKTSEAEMRVKTIPVQTEWVADGVTEYQMDVWADSTGEPNEEIMSSEWDVVVPEGLIVTRAELPSVDDFYEGWSPGKMEFDRVDSSISGNELTDNNRATNNWLGPQNKSGKLGSYWFIVKTDALIGEASFDMNEVKFLNPELYQWRSDTGTIAIENVGFEIIPEPATAGLLGLGVLGLRVLKGRRRKRE